MGKKQRFVGTVLAVLVIFAALHSVSAYGQEWKDDPEWWSAAYEDACSVLMRALHQEQDKKDGFAVHYVEDKLFWALLLHPNSFYEELSPDSVQYEEFIDDLHFVFWNFNDTTTAHLERLRIVAMERLVDQTYLVETKYLHLHGEMIEALRRVKVGHVD